MFKHERRNNDEQACPKCLPDKPCRDCRKRMYEEQKEKEQAANSNNNNNGGSKE